MQRKGGRGRKFWVAQDVCNNWAPRKTKLGTRPSLPGALTRMGEEEENERRGRVRSESGKTARAKAPFLPAPVSAGRLPLMLTGKSQTRSCGLDTQRPAAVITLMLVRALSGNFLHHHPHVLRHLHSSASSSASTGSAVHHYRKP